MSALPIIKRQPKDGQHPNLAVIGDILGRAEHPHMAAFLRHMQAIHPADRLPARSAFDPLAVRRLLPGLVLVAVEPVAGALQPRFKVKVAGQEVLDASPVPMMGRYLDEVVAEAGGSVMVEVRQQVLQTGLSYYWHGRPRRKFRFDFADLEYCHCPLAEDGSNIDHIVSFFHYKGAARS